MTLDNQREAEAVRVYNPEGFAIKLWKVGDAYVVTDVRVDENRFPLLAKSLYCLNYQHAETVFTWCVNSTIEGNS